MKKLMVIVVLVIVAITTTQAQNVVSNNDQKASNVQVLNSNAISGKIFYKNITTVLEKNTTAFKKNTEVWNGRFCGGEVMSYVIDFPPSYVSDTDAFSKFIKWTVNLTGINYVVVVYLALFLVISIVVIAVVIIANAIENYFLKHSKHSTGLSSNA